MQKAGVNQMSENTHTLVPETPSQVWAARLFCWAMAATGLLLVLTIAQERLW